MDVYKLSDNGLETKLFKAPFCLILGDFDGVHLGHQKLIRTALNKGPGYVGAALFDYDPVTHYSKYHKAVLTSLDTKLRLLEEAGVDFVYLLPLNEKLYNTSKEDFISKYLKVMDPTLIVVGEDYTFGQGALGKVDDLKEHFNVEVVPLDFIKGEKRSSSLIIKYILEGDFLNANQMWGRDFFIENKVVKGRELGHSLNYPTANIEFPPFSLEPPNGVYGTLSVVRGKYYPSITNIGDNPTIEGYTKKRIETHILNFNDDIYNETIRVYFFFKLRDEKKFPSLEELKNQIARDKEEYLARIEELEL